MKKAFFAIFAILFTIGTVSAQQSDKERCLDQIKLALRRLNILNAELSLPLLPLNTAELSNVNQNDYFRQHRIFTFSLGIGKSIDCIPETGQVVAFNGSTTDDVLYDQQPVPKMTLEQAAEEAKKWMKAFYGELPHNISAPRGTFSSNMRDAKRYYSGEWLIKWQRTDSKGHLFELDGLAASYSERLGLVGCSNNFDSSFEESKDPPISKEDAENAASPVAQEWLKRQQFAGRVVLGPASAELFVVNPNNFFQASRGDQIVSDLHARLAWSVIYVLIPSASTSPSIPSVALVVKIDSLSKQAIGGNIRGVAKK